LTHGGAGRGAGRAGPAVPGQAAPHPAKQRALHAGGEAVGGGRLTRPDVGPEHAAQPVVGRAVGRGHHQLSHRQRERVAVDEKVVQFVNVNVVHEGVVQLQHDRAVDEVLLHVEGVVECVAAAEEGDGEVSAPEARRLKQAPAAEALGDAEHCRLQRGGPVVQAAGDVLLPLARLLHHLPRLGRVGADRVGRADGDGGGRQQLVPPLGLGEQHLARAVLLPVVQPEELEHGEQQPELQQGLGGRAPREHGHRAALG
jgi:hypothetical protein